VAGRHTDLLSISTLRPDAGCRRRRAHHERRREFDARSAAAMCSIASLADFSILAINNNEVVDTRSPMDDTMRRTGQRVNENATLAAATLVPKCATPGHNVQLATSDGLCDFDAQGKIGTVDCVGVFPVPEIARHSMQPRICARQQEIVHH
jgi:hypothetical protein